MLLSVQEEYGLPGVSLSLPTFHLLLSLMSPRATFRVSITSGWERTKSNEEERESRREGSGRLASYSLERAHTRSDCSHKLHSQFCIKYLDFIGCTFHSAFNVRGIHYLLLQAVDVTISLDFNSFLVFLPLFEVQLLKT